MKAPINGRGFKPHAGKLSPAEAVAAAGAIAPTAPPAQVAPAQVTETQGNAPPPLVTPPERSGTLSIRATEYTLSALARHARSLGVTQKVLICQGLKAMGVPVADADLLNRPPQRRG